MNILNRGTGPVTLWLGMYCITALLFYAETGSLRTGLIMGLFSATLKTAWGLVHHHYLAGAST